MIHSNFWNFSYKTKIFEYFLKKKSKILEISKEFENFLKIFYENQILQKLSMKTNKYFMKTQFSKIFQKSLYFLEIKKIEL